jgi:hypothetical protein
MAHKFLVFIALLFLNSCGFNDIYQNIPKAEKPNYKKGDLVIFKSNSGIVDTFQISNYTNDYRVSDKRYYYEYIKFNYDSINPKSSFHFVWYERESSFIMLSFMDFGIRFDPSTIGTKNVIINNKVYSNVYELENPQSTSSPKITKLFYNHQYCILKYIENDVIIGN